MKATWVMAKFMYAISGLFAAGVIAALGRGSAVATLVFAVAAWGMWKIGDEVLGDYT